MSENKKLIHRKIATVNSYFCLNIISEIHIYKFSKSKNIFLTVRRKSNNFVFIIAILMLIEVCCCMYK